MTATGNGRARAVELVGPTNVVEAAKRGLESGLHPGMQVFATSGGSTLANFGIGTARDGAAMGSSTQVPWLSLSKVLVAILVAQAASKKILELDQLVTELLPKFGSCGKAAVSIRDLLAHAVPYASDIPLSVAADWDRALDAACSLPLVPGVAVGQCTRYTALASWQVLGELLQLVTGQPLASQVQEQITAVLGLRRTLFGASADRAAEHESDTCQVYSRSDGGGFTKVPFLSSERFLAAGVPGMGAVGPLSDLACIYGALMTAPGRDRLGIDADVWRELLAERQCFFDPGYGAKVRRGLGFVTDCRIFGVGRTNGLVFGHDGWRSSISFCLPQVQVVICVMANAFCDPYSNARRLGSVVRALMHALSPTAPSQDAPRERRVVQ